MSESYRALIEQFGSRGDPFKSLTTQLLFVFYLLLGQMLILLGWRLLVGKKEQGRSLLRDLGFAGYLLVAQVGLVLAWPWLVGAWQSAKSVLLADVVVTLHLAIVLGVLGTMVLVLIGWWREWSWTRSFWFRLAQLVVIEIVAGQAIVGLECPLTTMERHLRGGPDHLHDVENASRIGQWCNHVLYWDPPSDMPWFFPLVYGSVGILVLLTWVLAPPRWGSERPRVEPAASPRLTYSSISR